jgi:enoyl-CoA hydratase/carnithine racemase
MGAGYRVRMAVAVRTDGAVGRLVLDRPARAHAYDRAHLDALHDGIAALRDTVRVVVVESTGAGAFCGGADRAELDRASPLDAFALRSARVFEALAEAPFLSVAAVHGAAIAGGFELALACDLRVAAPAARFALPETALGLVPSAGGTTRLRAMVGPSRARELVLAGRELDAATALAWGIVHRVAEDARAEAHAWAAELAGRDAIAIAMAKELLRGADAGALARERAAEAILYARRDGR